MKSEIHQRRGRRGVSRRALLAGAAGSAVLATGFARTTSAQARDKLKLLIATSPPDPACHYFFYALKNGFYEKHGVDIDIKTITAETTTLRAMLAGEGEVAAFLGATTALQAYAVGGGTMRCISCFAPKLDYQIVAAKSVADMKALPGHTFGISQVGTVSQFVPTLMLKKVGVDPKKIKWVSIGGSAARLQGLVGKSIEAAAVNASLAGRGLAYDYLHVIGDAAETLPNFLYTWDITTASVIKEKHRTIKAFVDATAEGVRWGLANPEKAIAISQSVVPNMDKNEMATAIRHYIDKKFWSPSGVLPHSTWDYTSNAVKELGLIKQAPSYDQFVAKL